MATQLQRWTAVALLAAGVVAGACGGGDDKKESGGSTQSTGAATGPKVEVSAKEFSFDPAKVTMKAGEESTIVLKNTGSIEHDLTVADAGFKVTVAAGSTGQKPLKFDKPGTYQFHCSVSGHESAGMKGEITVS